MAERISAPSLDGKPCVLDGVQEFYTRLTIFIHLRTKPVERSGQQRKHNTPGYRKTP